MPNIYPQGLRVPELSGVASGGVSIVFHQPEELELLYALSSLAPRPPAAPLKSLGAALADPRLDLIAWHREWASDGTNFMPSSALDPNPKRGTNDLDTDDDPSDLSTLRNILVVLRTLWEADPADVPLLSCVVTIESDTDASEKGVSWDTRTANLTFGRGSLDVWLGRGPRRAMRFLAGLLLGGGIDSTARAPHLVKRARDRALARGADPGQPLGIAGPAAIQLRPLSELTLPEVAGQLVVLVHGLCSTDVGTFGDFETHLRSLAGVTVAGFPHDSLTTPIRLNAHALAQQIVKLGKPEVRLVCHSRGGLVARQTYVYLKDTPPPPSGGRWLHSCVTFGTPHLGTSVASSPETLTGVIMAAGHIRRSPGAASLVDVLCGSDGNGFVGVNELVPSAVEGSYLSKLEGQEKRLFLDDGFDLIAFGSVISRSSIWDGIGSSIVGRLLGTADHDILVPTSSSIPTLRAAPTQPLYNRSHFEYFTHLPTDPAVPQHFAQAVARMQLGGAVAAPA
ncbi:MAG TPA: hypothetical protein VH639_04680 [Bryobacteraceae bacterium]